MKRRGSSNIDGGSVRQAGGRKKSKRAKETKEEDGMMKNGGGEAAVITLESLLGREEWAWLRGAVVDEQMSWGWEWSPFWDVDFVDKAYGALFSDVAWDDDIWNLKTVMEIPNP